MTPELHRPVQASHIPRGGTSLMVEAAPADLPAIAARLQVPELRRLRCDWTLTPGPGGAIEAEGRLHAELDQVCVVSLDPFPVSVDEAFHVRFVAAGQESERADDPDEPDELPIEDGMLDLGEATVEQLALALDPYPRKPGAELPTEESDEAPHPFAALAKLRPPH